MAEIDPDKQSRIPDSLVIKFLPRKGCDLHLEVANTALAEE